MKILFIDNKSVGAPNIIQAMRMKGWEVTPVQTDIDGRRMPELEDALTRKLQEQNYDFLFSFNFFPVLAEVCHQTGVSYVSWTYDSPIVALYSYTMVYDTNYVFLFDYEQYRELKEIGLNRVFYLPLASNTLYEILPESGIIYPPMEISFVGSLYNEEKNDLCKKLEGISPYAKGYMDALIDAQKKIYGAYILQTCMTQKLIDEFQSVCPYEENNSSGVETAKYIYADYFLARRVTSLERIEVLDRLSKKHEVSLFSNCSAKELDHVHNMGSVNYYYDMANVFRKSSINLNITLKSIKSGIPQRMMDIMGAGGFLLTNYQTEMEWYFEAGVHYDYYSSMEELEEKAAYYLAHPQVSEKIARQGYEVVAKEFNYDKKLDEIVQIVKAG